MVISEFDMWRDQHRLSDLALSGLPSFSEIDGSQSSSIPASDIASDRVVPVFADVEDLSKTLTTGEMSPAVEEGRIQQQVPLETADNARGATRRSDLCYAVKRASVVSKGPSGADDVPSEKRADVQVFQQKFRGMFGKLSADDATFVLDFSWGWLAIRYIEILLLYGLRSDQGIWTFSLERKVLPGAW